MGISLCVLLWILDAVSVQSGDWILCFRSIRNESLIEETLPSRLQYPFAKQKTEKGKFAWKHLNLRLLRQSQEH
jgi:hypothetical protein